MSDPIQPAGYIKPQVNTQQIVPTQNVLVDDTVALVDDPNTYVGTMFTPASIPRLKASTNAVQGGIPQRR